MGGSLAARHRGCVLTQGGARAGSERVARSEAAGQALREAGAINRSLAALGDVVAALQRKAAHIPFRNSRLTQARAALRASPRRARRGRGRLSGAAAERHCAARMS